MNRGGSTLGQGHVPPRCTCYPHSQIQKLADRFDVISEVPKCSKFQWGQSLQRPRLPS